MASLKRLTLFSELLRSELLAGTSKAMCGWDGRSLGFAGPLGFARGFGKVGQALEVAVASLCFLSFFKTF